MGKFTNFFRSLSGRGGAGDGEVSRLISSRFFEDPASWTEWQVFCDLDKTYLETDFESLLAMAKIPFEEAFDKRTVFGATEVLTELRTHLLFTETGRKTTLHFVSSSPPQLRNVLEYKLSFDGLDWSSDSFKNQMRNFRLGRFHLCVNTLLINQQRFYL